MLCIVSPTAPSALEADFASFRFFGFMMLPAAIPTAAPTIMPVSAALVIVVDFVFFLFVFIFIFSPPVKISMARAAQNIRRNFFYI